jgi:putative ABC transport system permease protein
MQNTYGIMSGISLLAVIVGGVGVLNTMLMSVLERTREIGVLRALGWKRRSILSLIFKESLILAFLGGLCGFGFGFGLIAVLQIIPGVGEFITPIWGWDIIGRAMTIALLLGILGGLYPAFRATRLRPVEALRYE